MLDRDTAPRKRPSPSLSGTKPLNKRFRKRCSSPFSPKTRHIQPGLKEFGPPFLSLCLWYSSRKMCKQHRIWVRPRRQCTNTGVLTQEKLLATYKRSFLENTFLPGSVTVIYKQKMETAKWQCSCFALLLACCILLNDL